MVQRVGILTPITYRYIFCFNGNFMLYYAQSSLTALLTGKMSVDINCKSDWHIGKNNIKAQRNASMFGKHHIYFLKKKTTWEDTEF